MITNNFTYRHIGPREDEIKQMLEAIGVNSVDQLIKETIPAAIRLKQDLDLPDGMNEYEFLNHIRQIASRNKMYKSFIGLGYYNTITPGVILRNVFENPGWYTAYTPYQAEISQGRLEALLNYQTLISDLTGLPIANASLLDEGTSASEAMIMFYNSRNRDAVKRDAKRFFISDHVFAHTVEVIKTRANPLGIEVVTGSHKDFLPDDSYFGALFQYPGQSGEIEDLSGFVSGLHEKGICVAVAADLLSLTLLVPPGSWGADAVVGSSQRFGIPVGFGGPHAGYFSTTEQFKRSIPGRIIGISVDSKGNRALRMALQTREQHIKRERATSNICTAQALLASMAGMYATYHGPKGLKAIASDIHALTVTLATELSRYGYQQINSHYFDTLCIKTSDAGKTAEIRIKSLQAQMNFRYISDTMIGISIDETTTFDDIIAITGIFASVAGKIAQKISHVNNKTAIPEKLARDDNYLNHPVFNSYHSETEMMRYLKFLENKDLALNRSMIPLGSCTMKMNAAVELIPISWPEFNSIHPFAPEDQTLGYQEMIGELEKDLCEITGFSAVSFQPNSGAAGEYTGLLVIREYLKSKGQSHRNICLIPESAHGTNPASSVMAGMKVLVVKCDPMGNIDTADLASKAEQNKENLAALMITYPSTHGVFEENILEIIDLIHKFGGQVYMDGANMNAQVGLTNPGYIGADVCHLNLHKTFAIPHGGGGPGVGPIGVASHLAPFLPGHIFRNTGGKSAIGAVSSAPYGSALILAISYAYIKLLGGKGLADATRMAILNANYLKSKLQDHFPILYSGVNGRVAHEMILDCNQFSKTADIMVSDIAKRLMDYGFHAPTVAFPVHGTLMVEPTESEPFSELNRFIEAMVSIRREIIDIEEGKMDKITNPIKNAPHTIRSLTAENWDLPYTREKAAFPVDYLKSEKYWPPVSRIDDAFGDRNLVCTCSPVSKFL